MEQFLLVKIQTGLFSYQTAVYTRFYPWKININVTLAALQRNWKTLKGTFHHQLKIKLSCLMHVMI